MRHVLSYKHFNFVFKNIIVIQIKSFSNALPQGQSGKADGE